MIPNDFFAWGTVVVQGQQVTLTLELVNEFFELLDIPEAAEGCEEYEFFNAYNYDLAAALKTDGSGWWQYQQKNLLHSKFHLEVVFWHVFYDMNQQECCRRNNSEAKGASWPPNIQQAGTPKK
ncbi:hypothetical protein ACOSP7_016738 [Xanthoceras sorbifolium]